MPRLAFYGELNRKISLLTYADKPDITPDAGCQAGADAAALVDDTRQLDAAFLEQLPHHLGAVHAARFLVMTHAEQNGALRAEPLLEQNLGRVHDADQLVLDVQRTAAPDEAIDNLPLERRMGPLGRVSGDHILVRHH